MTTKSMMNKFSRLKENVYLLHEDIRFLRACKRHQVMPHFIKIKTAVENSRSIKAIKMAQKYWLNSEISYIFNKLAEKELELYNIHLQLAYNNNAIIDEWYSFENTVHEKVMKTTENKKKKQSKKLICLINEQIKPKTFKPEVIPDFVVNESGRIFNEEELELLNKGLKYSVKPRSTPIIETVVDLESCLKFKSNKMKEDNRSTTTEIIKNLKKNTVKNNDWRIIKELKEKDCVYVKADKGNKLVILNATDYEQRMQLLIEECAYKEMKRNPLSSMIRECDAMRSRIGKMFSPRLQRSLNVSNPIIAKLYGLPKIHKPGNKMRPIVSNVNTPCYKMAKWLVKEIKNLPAFDTLSV